MGFESRQSAGQQGPATGSRWARSVGTAAQQVSLMLDLAFGRKGFRATSRVAQIIPLEGRTCRFMKYHLRAPQPVTGCRGGRETPLAAEESRQASCFLRYTADSDRVGSAALAW